MATSATSRSGSDTASVPFSYAQAAKGLSTGPGSSSAAAAAVSKASSGTATPARDSQTVTTSTAAAVMSWAEDAEANDPSQVKSVVAQPPPAIPKPSTTPNELPASLVSSPEMGASTVSTVAKDDDVSSIPNTSSDSTWENKSQASTSVDKSTEASEQPTQKDKTKKTDKALAKPLQEAPIPVVNIWQQRAEQRQKPAKPAPATASPSGASPATKQTKDALAASEAEINGKPSPVEMRSRGSEEDKPHSVRKELKVDVDVEKTKKGVKGRAHEKETKPVSNTFTLPPDRDNESWPTPETATDGDRKKAQKTEKSDKERKESSSGKPGGKKEWVQVPITPTVVFNTPLPNSGARRGGRPARGGAQTGGRTGTYTANSPEKDGSASTALPNGEQYKRGRVDAPARDSSPKAKRASSAGSLLAKDRSVVNGEKSSKAVPVEGDFSARASVTADAHNTQTPSQHNTFPRPYPPNRPNKNRKGEWPGSDRKRDGDSNSHLKENGVSNEQRNTSAAQPDGLEEGERRGAVYADGQPPHSSKRGSGDRFGFLGRRGGARGGRGNYSNGHQFVNGHAPSVKPSSGFPGPMSPTTFNPEQTPYFPPAGRYRNSARSQSVTNESIYRAQGQFGGPQQMPPLNTYNMYDYSAMQPMSAVPYTQYGVDHFALLSMVTTQLEYYFSIDNLCKDMFLRKHMDSKGFVFLNVISEFNRIKQLTTDLELIKLVCYQSRMIEFRIGHDGKDRLRAREGWQQWILPLAERDVSAQNEGPEELYNPPLPHPAGFDPNGSARYPADMPAPPAFSNEIPYPMVNGFHPGAAQHAPVPPSEGLPNGATTEGVNGNAMPNGHPTENATKAVSGTSNLFSNEQVQSLTVIVRKQDTFQMPVLPPFATCTFSNGNTSSRSDVPDDSEKMTGEHANLPPCGIGSISGIEGENRDQRERTTAASRTSPTSPLRLYWVKDNDSPVDFVPSDCSHESYYMLRSKALQQRQHTIPGTCSHDMSVLYHFWSHFLIRNFNRRMFDEFRRFALEDARSNQSKLGISHLINFYRESLLSSQNIIQDRVACDCVDLVRSELRSHRPALRQFQSVLRNSSMDARIRARIGGYLDDELKALLE